ncbi:hypothetical protein TRIUR3_00561 [Triticum urartu]|uniref:Mitochondrial import inner membrane translocase subunit Tim21 n=1 Tax=Triticum urartu TaxID=4572 RepID=M8AF36_TRIUA|nr:hypothetical protein TRIUR3_00561 [Triticum urartu]
MFALRRQAASTSAPLLRRRLLYAQPNPMPPPPTPRTPSNDGAWAWAERAAKLSLLGFTGAATACAVKDTSVFLDRTRVEYVSNKVMEMAAQNQQVASAIGGPMTPGFWHSISIAWKWNLARHYLSGTLQVSGPQGDGLLTFQAVRSRDKSWFRFLRYSDWEIPIMDAILDVRTDDGKHQRITVRIPDNMTAPPPQEKTRYFVITQNMIAIKR